MSFFRNRYLAYVVLCLFYASSLAVAEVRKGTQEDLELGNPAETVTSPGGHVGHKIPRCWDNNGFNDNCTLYSIDLITKGPWVDVRASYGGLPGAVADDNSAAVQTANVAAFRAALAYAVPLGLPIKFGGHGVYYFNDNIVIPDAAAVNRSVHIVIEGVGSPDLGGSGNNIDIPSVGGTVLKYTVGNGSNFITYQPTYNYGAITFNNIEIRGPDTDSSATSGDGLRIIGDAGSGRTVVFDYKNLSINHFRGGYGVYLYYCENGSGSNLTVNRNKYGAILTGASNANRWSNFVGQYNTDSALSIIDSLSISVSGLIQANPKNGLFVNGGEELDFNIHFESNNTTAPYTYRAVDVSGTSGRYNTKINFNSSRFAGAHDDVFLTGVADGTTSYVTFAGSRSIVTDNSVIINNTNVLYTYIWPSFGGTIYDAGIWSVIGYPNAVISGFSNITLGNQVGTNTSTRSFVIGGLDESTFDASIVAAQYGGAFSPTGGSSTRIHSFYSNNAIRSAPTPTSSALSTTNFRGTDNVALTTPLAWFGVVINGTAYQIPLYTYVP